MAEEFKESTTLRQLRTAIMLRPPGGRDITKWVLDLMSAAELQAHLIEALTRSNESAHRYIAELNEAVKALERRAGILHKIEPVSFLPCEECGADAGAAHADGCTPLVAIPICDHCGVERGEEHAEDCETQRCETCGSMPGEACDAKRHEIRATLEDDAPA